MDIASTDELLTTTRSVRKRLDLKKPVDPKVVERCIEIAFQSPTGSNRQGWHMLVVTDADKRTQQLPRVVDSAQYLADHLHEVPVHVIPCIDGRFENGGTLAQASMYGS